MADDYCLLAGRQVYSYPKAINLFSYNLRQHPWLKQQLSVLDQARTSTAMSATTGLQLLSRKLPGGAHKVAARLAELSEVASNFSLLPSQLGITTTAQASIDQVVALIPGSDSRRCRLTAEQLAEIAYQTIRYEHTRWWNWYRMYRFYRPDATPGSLEMFGERYRGLLAKLSVPISRHTVAGQSTDR